MMFQLGAFRFRSLDRRFSLRPRMTAVLPRRFFQPLNRPREAMNPIVGPCEIESQQQAKGREVQLSISEITSGLNSRPSQARQRNHRGAGGRLWPDGPSIRGVLVQRIMNPDVIAHRPAEVLLTQRDDRIEDLVAATSDPSFRDSVLPWRLNACPFRFQTEGLQAGEDVGPEDRVAVQDGVAIRTRLW